MLKPFLFTAAVAAAGLLAAPTASADDFTVCPSGITGVATDDTSCAFADNVGSAWRSQPGSVVTAYSPVAQQSITMQCAPTVTDRWAAAQRCVGANFSGVDVIVFVASPSAASGPLGQTATGQDQPIGSAPSAGVGADADSPNLPNVNAPNVGCTWVNAYTRSNGTNVSGHWRC
jgi:hypothetical protein